MRIEFLNVWGGRTGKVLRDYLEAEAKTTDIFCFQEADKDFPTIAEEVLRPGFELRKAYKFVSKDDIFPQEVYVKKAVEIVSAGTVLEGVENVGLGVAMEVRNGVGRVNLVNVHGVSRPGDKMDTEKRLEQSRGIIEQYQGIDGPVIIGGDFNLNETTESVAMFAKNGYRNLIEEFGIEATRNSLAWKKFPDNPQKHSNFVFVRGVEVKNFEVIKNEVSDHLPVVLEIE